MSSRQFASVRGSRSFRAAGAQQLCSTKPREPPRASPSARVQWPATRGYVVGVVAGIPRWQARGQGFKSPQLHHHLPAETARLAAPAAGPAPARPQSGGITVWQARYQAMRDRRHLARDLRRATPAAGQRARAPLPASSATALGSTLRAEGGLPCSLRLGRSRVRHRRDLGRAARATLYAGGCVARRGMWLWRLGHRVALVVLWFVFVVVLGVARLGSAWVSAGGHA
jgi:hypothetical protein